MSPFQYSASFFTKKYADDISEYAPFIVNKALSLFAETILYANEMNKYHSISHKMQYDYLFYSIRKQKPPYSKWPNKSKKGESDIEVVQEYFKYNVTKAKQAFKVLSKEQIDDLRLRLEKGGRE